MRPRRLVPALLLLGCVIGAGAVLLAGRLAPGGASTAVAEPSKQTVVVRGQTKDLQPRVAPGPVCTPGTTVRLESESVAYAVSVVRRAVAYRQPGVGRIAAFGRLNVNHVPTVFGVLGARVDASCQAAWYRVQLPLRPNGITGWVRASAVTARTLRTRIVVDLSARRVTLFRSGKPILVVPAAIGSSATPTPTGRYFVNQKLVAPDPWGAFGPVALGISAFSPVLKSWAQGGPIAIHGTNEATLLGGAVSHGCIRVSNRDDLRLYRLAPTGTPVLIRM